MLKSCETYHPGKKEDTPQRDGGTTPWPTADPGDQHPYKNLSDTRGSCHLDSIAVDKNYRKIYQRKPPTPEYEQQWAPNTIQTIIMICNAKGIPNAIAQKL